MHFIFWHHLGLDFTDIEDIPNKVPFAKEAFATWFVLQHLRGYRPFITYIPLTYSFTGTLNGVTNINITRDEND